MPGVQGGDVAGGRSCRCLGGSRQCGEGDGEQDGACASERRGERERGAPRREVRRRLVREERGHGAGEEIEEMSRRNEADRSSFTGGPRLDRCFGLPWLGASLAGGPARDRVTRPWPVRDPTGRAPNVRLPAPTLNNRMSALTPFTDLQDIAKAVTHRQASPVELVREILDAIGRHNPSLNAYITVSGEAALEAAERVEKLVAAKKDPGPLAGVPIAIKDLILTSDAPTTAGSRVFGDGIPAGDEATVVKRLRKAGAIIIGKTNLHEVALGVTSANEHFGPARNPWNAEHVSGGSSGGSASAVAAGLCAASIGTDTRGSIRIPAACCGVTGFKPTYGLLPNDGIVPLSPSLDHVGPITHTVADAALLVAVMTGTKPGLERFVKALRTSSKGIVLGVSEYHLRDLDGEIGKAIDKALKVLRPLVKDIRDVDIPALDGAQEASGIITASEAIAYHDRYLKHNPAAYGPLVRKRLEGGYKHSALDYLNAMAKREAVRAAFAQTFTEVDVLVGATLPALPPRVDEDFVHIDGKEENTVEAFTRFNAPQNLAGLPAISVPCGLAKGLPIGLQFFGPEGGDEVVLTMASAFQRETHWHQRRPPIAR